LKPCSRQIKSEGYTRTIAAFMTRERGDLGNYLRPTHEEEDRPEIVIQKKGGVTSLKRESLQLGWKKSHKYEA